MKPKRTREEIANEKQEKVVTKNLETAKLHRKISAVEAKSIDKTILCLCTEIKNNLFKSWYDDERTIDIKGQLFRSVVSIASNQWEGYGRGTLGGRSFFLKIAKGSAMEAYAQAYMLDDQHLLTVIGSMISLLNMEIDKLADEFEKETSIVDIVE